jgi:hypothetical protein
MIVRVPFIPALKVIAAAARNQAKSMPKRIPDRSEDEEIGSVNMVLSFRALDGPLFENGVIGWLPFHSLYNGLTGTRVTTPDGCLSLHVSLESAGVTSLSLL